LSDKLTLEEAKAKFVAAMDAVDPVKAVQEKPFKFVGFALAAGVMLGMSGRKIPLAMFPLAGIAKKNIRREFCAVSLMPLFARKVNVFNVWAAGKIRCQFFRAILKGSNEPACIGRQQKYRNKKLP